MTIGDRIIIPLVTPFKKDFSIDYESMERHVSRLIENGLKYLFPVSSTGEIDKISKDEVIEISRFLSNKFKNTFFMVGILSMGTKEAVDLINSVENNSDVYGFVVPPPPYFKPDSEELINYYSTILESTDKQIIIYVIPSTTGILIDPNVFRHLLSKYDNLYGVKITFNDITYLHKVFIETRNYANRFRIYVGSDLLSLPNLVMGGYGVIPGLGNIFPKLYIGMLKNYLAGDYGEAIKVYRDLLEIATVFEIPYNFPAVVKFCLELLRLNVSRIVRPPMKNVEDKYENRVLTLLGRYERYV